MPPKRSTKHVKPAFDVVRDAIEDTRTGWVYRSDTARPAAKPRPSTPPPAAAARFVPSLESVPPPRLAAAPQPKPASAVPSSFGWMAGAMAVMSLPLVITAGIMIAPIAFVWAARKSTNG
jgi:hypothetical protein